MGGIAIQYLDSEMRGELDINLSFSNSSDISSTASIPYKAVNDFQISALPGNMTLRRRGFKFDNPTRYQKDQVEVIIRDHTVSL